MQQIHAVIKPKSTKGPLITENDGNYIIYVKELASGGKANAAAILALAKYLNIAPSCVQLVKGQKSHIKTFLVDKG